MANLYHYAKLSILSKILEAMRLKFGSLPKMNDFTGRTMSVYIDSHDDSSWRYIPVLKNRIKSIKQISPTHDEKFEGYAINAMWGHDAMPAKGIASF